MVQYDRYPNLKESTVDRRRRRRILRRDRRRGRWLALVAVSTVMAVSWVVLSRAPVSVAQLQRSLQDFLQQSLQQSLEPVQQSAQTLIQPPRQLPGSATAAPPRQVEQDRLSQDSLQYEDWVGLLQREVDTVAAKGLPDLSILAGDSISLWFPENLLPTDQPWLNQGISGETTAGLQKRIEAWQALRPRRIFLMIGINDLIRGAQTQAVIATNRRLIQVLRQAHPEAQIVVQSILPHSGLNTTWEGKDKLQQVSIATIQQINRELAAIAQAESVRYLDLYPLFCDRNGFLRQDLTTDGLHLNPQGYLVWSTALKMFEQQALDPPTLGRAETQAIEPAAEVPVAELPAPEVPAPEVPAPEAPMPEITAPEVSTASPEN